MSRICIIKPNVHTPSDSLNIPKQPLPTDVINWCETLNRSTGLYDFAFSRLVLQLSRDGLQSEPEPSAVQLFCIEFVFSLDVSPFWLNMPLKSAGQVVPQTTNNTAPRPYLRLQHRATIVKYPVVQDHTQETGEWPCPPLFLIYANYEVRKKVSSQKGDVRMHTSPFLANVSYYSPMIYSFQIWHCISLPQWIISHLHMPILCLISS